jgi:2-amino-4-hydroxy-6-hydroxymethyldihydropteridine diphosphokinase
LVSSSVYRTKAWGIEDQPDFLNQVLEVESDLSAMEILKIILEIEQSLGRKRDIRWSKRIIDIDILYYGDEIIDLPGLTVPHPEIQNRNFTLAPLCDIAPGFVHPKLLKTQRELLDSSPDTLGVEKFIS